MNDDTSDDTSNVTPARTTDSTSAPTTTWIAALTKRVEELEIRYTHLQRTTDQMHEVLLEQGKQIDALTRKLTMLIGRMDALSEGDVEPRSLEDDKPPHY